MTVARAEVKPHTQNGQRYGESKCRKLIVLRRRRWNDIEEKEKYQANKMEQVR